jgi:hypothetical protein
MNSMGNYAASGMKETMRREKEAQRDKTVINKGIGLETNRNDLKTRGESHQGMQHQNTQ